MKRKCLKGRIFGLLCCVLLSGVLLTAPASLSGGEAPAGEKSVAGPVFAVPDADGFVPGASGREGDRAVLLAGGRFLEISAGPDHPSGDGCLFLPHRRGTIEFFMRPIWGSEEASEGRRRLLMARMKEPGTTHYYQLDHYLEDDTLRWWFRGVHDESGGNRSIRGQGEYLFEKGRWVHVAWTWGESTEVFVDGKRVGRRVAQRGFVPVSPMRVLMVGYFTRSGRPDTNINAEIDDLRISGTVRYDGEFTPPEPGGRFEMDEDTRLLMTFDGDAGARSYGHEGPVSVSIRK